MLGMGGSGAVTIATLGSAKDAKWHRRGRLDVVDGKLHNFLDHGTRGAAPHRGQQSLLGLEGPVGRYLDTSIGAVPNPTGHLPPLAHLVDEVPKPHSVDPPNDANVEPCHTA